MSHRLTMLDNGLRIVTEDNPHLETAAVGVWVDVGARHEAHERNGVSHLLEHMAFKGTRRRSARAIAEEIEAVGGHLNAYTSREHTAYYARVLKEDLGLGIDILSDILQHSTFDPVELDRERQVIVQEIGQALDTPDDVIFDMLQETAYPDQAVGRSILGTVERIENLPRDTVAGHMAEHYRAPAMVLTAAGRVDHDALVEMAGERFGALGPANPMAPEAARYVGGDARDVRDLEQAHVALGFPGVPHGDPDYYAYQVYATVLGGGMSSRLFQEVREVRGLAYSVFAYSTSLADDGMIGVYAGTGADEVAELVPVIAEEMAKLATDASEEEVARARAQMKAGLLMSLESPSSRIEQLARHTLIHGRVLSTAELVAAIDAVDASRVRAVAERVARTKMPTLAALGPIERLEDAARVAARFG
jgi:predicted Zn-dependent peptidase